MRLARFITLVVLILGMSAASARANTITLNYDFSASGFPAGAPVDPVTGSFSVTFDNATDLIDVTSGITLTGLNIALDSAPSFTYLQSIDALSIGGLENGASDAVSLTNDFVLVLQNVSTAPSLAVLGYTQVSAGPTAGFIGFGTLTPTAPVPEPASLTLLGLGLAGMGARRWRQRKA